jgi:uncharacterized membrane protein
MPRLSVAAGTTGAAPHLATALLLALGVVPAVAGVARLVSLATAHAPVEDARFFDEPLPVVLHVLAVIPYALLGALQFSPVLRGRWHRRAGTVLVPLGLVAALTGLWMTAAYPWPPGDGEALWLMRWLVGGAMFAAIVRGVVALTRRDYVTHGVWMLRGYALGMGAGTQVLTHLPWFVLFGDTPDESSRAVMMALGWIGNAVAAEYVIRRRRTAAHGMGAPRRPMPARPPAEEAS